jgi:hypothetical protein
MARQPRLLTALDPGWRWSWLLAASLFVLLGSWLSLDPLARRAWLVRRLEQLTAWRQTAAEREARARQTLLHALKLFEEVDAQCRREEAAADAVFQRRPGVQRYVAKSGAVVAVTVPQVARPKLRVVGAN